MMALAMQNPAAPDRPILVVDDDAKIVRLVRTYLERDGFSVVTAADGPAALDAIETHQPALVVLDLMLPELDGRAVIRAVRRDEEAGGDTDPRPLGAGHDDRPDRRARGRRRRLPAEALLAGRARRPRQGDPPPSRAARRPDAAASSRADRRPIHHNDLVLDPARHEVTVDGSIVQLTHVEFRLLQTLLEADGRVLSRDQLLDAVYGADQSEVLDRTIDVHIRRLRDKLGDDPDAPRYVATVRGAGLSIRAGPRLSVRSRGIATRIALAALAAGGARAR